MNILLRGLLLMLLMLPALASGEMYRYTDRNGELHFVDDISKVPKKYRKQVRDAEPEGNLAVMDATPNRPVRKQAEQERPRRESVTAGSGNVEVFMTSWCGYCKKMIRYLNEKGIPYTAYDIEKDSAAAEVYRGLGGSGVPVVRIGTHVVHGYSPEAVMAYYKGQ